MCLRPVALCLLLCALALSAFAGTRKPVPPKPPTSKSKTTASKSASSATIARNPYLAALVVDAATGKVLIEENADTRAYPASVLKLMDLLIILEKIQQGSLHLTNIVKVTAEATRIGGSQAWLAENETFSLDDMLYALMIRSANDVAVALAIYTAGSKAAFVELMNQRARELGMTATRFYSVHGLPPTVGQDYDVTSARDLSILARELLKYPDALRYTSTMVRYLREGTPKALRMENHNHLLGKVDGCDGMKTGFFTKAGFSIVATAQRNGVRIIAVILGSQDREVRNQKAAELLNRGFALAPPPAAIPAAPANAVVTNALPTNAAATNLTAQTGSTEKRPGCSWPTWTCIAWCAGGVAAGLLLGSLFLRRSRSPRDND